MNAPSSPLLFGSMWLVVTALVFLLPLLPALRELYSRSDADALAIDPLDNGRTDYAAQRMAEQLGLLEAMPRVAQWRLDDQGRLMVPRGHGRLMAKTGQPLVIGFRSQLRALVSSDMVELQANSSVQRVLHAKSIHCLGPVQLARLTSAERHIVLAPGTRFFRLAANCVFTWPLKRSLHFPLPELGNGMPLTELQKRHEGDLRIAAGSVVQGGLVVTGNLWMEEMTVVVGHIKVHGNASLAKGACVQGALFVLGDLQTKGNNYVEGPLCAGKRLQLGPESQVGSKQCPSSVSAWSIALQASVRVYGSIAAVRSGQVVL